MLNFNQLVCILITSSERFILCGQIIHLDDKKIQTTKAHDSKLCAVTKISDYMLHIRSLERTNMN